MTAGTELEDAGGMPVTGDLVVDAALADLAASSAADLDATLAAGTALEGVLRERLSDLSG